MLRSSCLIASFLAGLLFLGRGGFADAPLVAVVADSARERAALAADVIASDLSAAGIAVLPMERVAAAIPAGSKLPATATDAAALARVVGASHAVLIRLDEGGAVPRLVAHLCPADAGQDTVPLQQSPRAVSTLEGVRFPAHQAANLAAVRLTGRAIADLPSIFQDRMRGKTLGFGRSVSPPADPLASGIKVTLTIDRPGGVYRVGEEVKCTLTVDRDCYIALYNIDPQGKPVLLLPGSEYETDKIRPEKGRYLSMLRAKGGTRYQVPGDWVGDGIGFTVQEGQPVGYESLVVVAGTDPVPLPVRPAGLAGKDLRIEADGPSEFANRQAALLLAPGRPASPTGIAEVKFTTGR